MRSSWGQFLLLGRALSLRPAWTIRPTWLGVALSCLLSLTAPCDLSIFVQVLETGPALAFASSRVHEVEVAGDREEDMLRPASVKAAPGTDRKAARALPGLLGWPVNPSASLTPSPLPGPRLAGSEHAGRNGVGTPLLC